MRTGITFLLVMSILITCTACNKGSVFVPQDDIEYNYNNISSGNCDFWLTNDTVYYKASPIYTLYYYKMNQSKKNRIACAGNAAFAKLLEYEQVLYMLDWTDEASYRLHSYNLKTGKQEQITQLDNVHTFFVVREYIYFLQEDTLGKNVFPSFHVYSIRDGMQKQIASSVLTAGVVNGYPTYIIQEGDTFSIHSYNVEHNTSTVLGKFDYSIGDRYLGCSFNFTDTQYIFEVSSGETSTLVCYDFKSDQITEYMIDGNIYSAVAYQEYIFLVVCSNCNTGDSELWDNVIYRLCLEDGTSVKITDQKGMVNMFVGSDDCVYISTVQDWKHIYKYSLNGHKTLVCRR